MVRGLHEMLRICCLLHQPSNVFDDVSTQVFDSRLIIVIPSDILESVLFPLPDNLIIWHANPELVYEIPVFEAWEPQDSICFP
jgi:hypothetical protein